MLRKIWLAIIPLLVSCTHVLYEDTDIHYTEKCGDKPRCERTLMAFRQMCTEQHKGSIIVEEMLQKNFLHVQCRPANQ